VTTFAYHRPDTVEDLHRVLAETPGRVELLAGGTDVLVGVTKGTSRPEAIIDLKRVEVLSSTLESHNGALRVGALALLRDLIDDDRIQRDFEALVEAAAVVGSVQIRNRATLVGNVCNASPAADTIPTLLVYGARVNVLGADGERTVPLEEFFTGPGTTVLRLGDLVTSIDLPAPTGPRGAAFDRLTRRRGFDLGTVSVACLVAPGMPTRFGLGAVAPTPLFALDEWGVLGPSAGDPAAEDRALAELAACASPISDVRGSREYRLAMLAVLCRRVLALARARLAGDLR